MKSCILAFLMLYLVESFPILDIPIKSLTDSNIIYTDFDKEQLSSYITNSKLDYNEFYIDITIMGKEQKILKLSLDTTLNTNIFTSNTCQKCLIDDIPVLWNITYNKKSLSLGQLTEDILLNDDNNLLLAKYPINLMYLGEDSIEIPFDGVLGLGLDSFIKGNTSSNLLNYLYQMGYIETRQFSFALYRDDNKTKLIMGGYDGTLLKTPFNYHTLANNRAWSLNLTGVSLNKEPLLPSNQVQTLVFDTSTSNIIGPKKEILAIIAKINEMAGFKACKGDSRYFLTCQCKEIPFEETLMFEIAFHINNKDYPLYLEDLLISYTEETDECNFALSYSDKTKIWTIGTKFFERYYVMFDADSLEIAISEVDLMVLMGPWLFTQDEMEVLSVLGFFLLILSLVYFMVYVLREGKSSKEFQRVNNGDKEVSYLEDREVFVITGEGKKDIELKEIKREEKVDNMEVSHTI